MLISRCLLPLTSTPESEGGQGAELEILPNGVDLAGGIETPGANAICNWNGWDGGLRSGPFRIFEKKIYLRVAGTAVEPRTTRLVETRNSRCAFVPARSSACWRRASKAARASSTRERRMVVSGGNVRHLQVHAALRGTPREGRRWRSCRWNRQSLSGGKEV